MKTKGLRLIAGMGLVVLTSAALRAYVYLGNHNPPEVWAPGTVELKLMVDNSTVLNDGTTRATTIQAAVMAWNNQIASLQLLPIIRPTGLGSYGNAVNEVFFADSIFDASLDSSTLAVTVTWTRGDTAISEADVVFNTYFVWNSYRGNLQGGVHDIRRVAMHELGHVLGLDHPDQYSQSVAAIMNSVVSNVDSLQADDIAGAQSLYGMPGAPPANDSFSNANLMYAGGSSDSSNFNATKETGEPNHGGNAGGKSVWWKCVAPGTGTLTVTTLNSNFDTVLGVYTGSSVSALTPVASNDDVQPGVTMTSAVTFAVTSGTTYYFAVDGKDGQSGRISVSSVFSTTPISAPAIVSQPVSRSVATGMNATFVFSVSGYPFPIYQWQRLPVGGGSWANLANNGIYSGVTGSTLSIAGAQLATSGDQFRCIASNSAGSVQSSAATLTVAPAPFITQQPIGGEVYPGAYGIGFGISFNGAGTVTWYRDSTPVKTDVNVYGVSVYTILGAQPGDSGIYRAHIASTNPPGGSYDSDPAPLLVSPTAKPWISQQPRWYNPISVEVRSLDTPTYQWRFRGVDIPGATSSSYFVNNLTPLIAGPYSVAVTNAYGTVVSGDGYIDTGVPPQFGTTPFSQNVLPGAIVTFTVAVGGWPPINYQWQVLPAGSSTWSNLPESAPYQGVTTTQLVLTASLGMNGSSYRCVATDYHGSSTSGDAMLVVSNAAAPGVSDPVNSSVIAGTSAQFTVSATGNPPPSLQWQRQAAAGGGFSNLSNGGSYSGVTSATLTVSAASSGMSGDQFRCVATNVVSSVTSAAAVLTVTVTTSDFNGDGKSDILWENTTTGDRGFWLMNGPTFSSWVALGAIAVDWRIVAAADFNADGKSDLLWENTVTGDRVIWLMNGTGFVSAVALGTVGTEWRIAAVGDFNGDGKPDLVWENTVTGDRGFWIMNGTNFVSWVDAGIVGTDWRIAGVGDFNGDGKTDVLWSNTATGDCGCWIMNGTGYSSWQAIGTMTTDWRIAGVGDFNADGKPDLLWENTGTGLRYIWLMNGTGISSAVSLGVVTTDWRIAN